MSADLLHEDYKQDVFDPTRKGPWKNTVGGKLVHIFDMRPEDFDIHDIAHHLALLNRWGGATKFPFSVAQHSTHIASRLLQDTGDAEIAMWGLMHDAVEAYLTDIPRPIKAVWPEFQAIEAKNMEQMAEAFGLPWPVPPAIKEYDERMAATEKKHLITCSVETPHQTIDDFEPFDVWGLVERDWHDARDRFLEMYCFLNVKRKEAHNQGETP